MSCARLVVVVALLALLPPTAGGPLTAPASPRLAAAAVPPTGTGWRPPLQGRLRVTRGFAPPASPYAAGSRGVDLAAGAGAVVGAAGPGRVVFAGQVAGRTVVSVLHPGGLRTTYEPLAGLSVRAGQEVAAGQRLGLLSAGRAGCPVAACLHWGVRRDAGRAAAQRTYLDPLLLLGLGPPRLLPLAG